MLKNGIVSDSKGNISEFLLCLVSLKKEKVNPNILLNFFCGFLSSPSSECTQPSEVFGFLFLGNYSKHFRPAEVIHF